VLLVRETAAPSGRSAGRELAVAEALLRGAAGGATGPVLRIYRPPPTVAFGRLDALRPGFAEAAAAARAHGYAPVVRVLGGHAVAYDGSSLVVDHADAADAGDAVPGTQARFAAMGGRLADALRSLGVDARVGEVPLEFCPGPHGVNARGRVKLVGSAQRVVRGGWLLSASLVIRDAAPVRAVLVDVYAALGLEWDPATAGAVADEVPGVSVAAVADAIVASYGARYELEPAALDGATLAAAAELPDRTVAPAQPDPAVPR
jgi:octanoyl-[GcvH]:protein N-octanoyltransferase